MNKLHFKMYAFLLAAFMLLSCSKDSGSPITPEIELGTDALSFVKEGQQKSFKLTTNLPWTIQSNTDWCVVSPLSGEAGTNPIKVVTEANTTTESRSAEVLIISGDLTQKLKVTQAQSYLLEIENESFTLTEAAQEIIVELTKSDEVDITVNNDWIKYEELKAENTGTEKFLIDANDATNIRKGTITFKLDDIEKVVTVTQGGRGSYIEADKIGVESNATELAAKLGIGWNVGNSLEVPTGETTWGNPMVSEKLIQGVKAAGFTAVRIPCAWDSHIIDENTYEISPEWFSRVKEVVDYCINNDMYAIINIHWDGGWLEENPVYSLQDAINQKQEALWKQIAVYFRDYDEHLLFAGTNEVHANYGTPSTENLEVQQSFNQTFVTAVRSTGGKNFYRNLIVQTYNTNVPYGVQYHKMPNDVVEDRLMLEVHYYDPWDFCGQTDAGYKTEWGSSHSDISTWGQETYLNEQFTSLKETFVDAGIPVILGEYGALLRSALSGQTLEKHLASHNYYLKTVTQAAIDNGVVPFIWDNGVTGNNGFGLFNRSTGEKVHEDAINAIVNSGN